MNKERRVQVGKIDLDTAGACLFIGLKLRQYDSDDKVEVLPGGQATPEDLANPDVVCIEVGGSGQVYKNNFDHHGKGFPHTPKGEEWSATKQAAWMTFRGLEGNPWRPEKPEDFPEVLGWGWSIIPPIYIQLIEYINELDIRGPQALGPKVEGLFPTLSDVFAGMLLVTRDPVEQLRLGVKMLREVLHRGIEAYGRMPIEKIPEWATYAKAKVENNRQVAKAVEKAQWGTTSAGLKLAWLETDFFGAPGALYGVGAHVVVVYSHQFGPGEGVSKFTVAGNGIRVDKVLPELNAWESGWGGPASGTILDSPREGSKMTLKEVVEIVRRTL